MLALVFLAVVHEALSKQIDVIDKGDRVWGAFPPLVRKGVRDGRFSRTKQLAVVVAIVSLAMVWTFGMTTAQTSEEGIANFYNDSFQGKKTASGDVYDKDGLTASHKKHAFGTKLKVTNIESGKSVVVTVTDRMGRKNPAVIDVTRRAAEELGFVKSGKARVNVEVAQ